jgi:thiol-disulfide isomerase/thioredoxin
MKKAVMLSGTMLLVLLLASCNLEKSTNQSVDVVSQVRETSSLALESMEKTMTEPVVLAQGFAEYDESFIGETDNTVLFFHQESCGTCKATEKSLIEEWVPSDLQVLKIDIDADSSVELKQKYWVTMKHTFVQIDASGEMIKKWNGSLNADDIVEQLAWDAMMDKSEDSIMEGDEFMEEKAAMEKVKADYDTQQMKDDTMTEESDEMMKDDESMEKTEVMTKELAWTYANYDESMVGKTEDTVIFVHATWCPSCRAADDAISSEVIPDRLTILKANFDNSTDLRKKYGVVAQHTFVQVDPNGNEVKKWLGGNSVEDVVERLQ